MKVILLRPWGVSDEVIPPIGLGYLASALRPRHEVLVVDALRDRIMPRDLARAVTTRPDVFGITAFSKELGMVRDYLAEARRLWPECVTILGGAHASSEASRLFTHFPEHLDYGFVGEAEIGLAQLLDRLDGGPPTDPDLARIPGLIYRTRAGQPADNPPVHHEPLDDFQCAWDLMPPDSYPPLPHGAFYRGYPVAPVIVTRGCPFRCAFCAAHRISGYRKRLRSLAHVLAEVELLVTRYGVRELHIEDDHFTADRAYVRGFCRALKDRGWNLSWTCPNGVRLDTLDAETLALMRDAGCYILSVGIESGSDRVLSLMRKHLDTKTIREKVEMIHAAGILVSGFFLIGYPGETAAELEETFRFSRSLPLIRATYSYFQPFPGSDLARSLPTPDLVRADLSLHHISYLPEGLTAAAMHRRRQHALLRFYLRPRVLGNMVTSIRSWTHFKGVARRAWRWLRA